MVAAESSDPIQDRIGLIRILAPTLGQHDPGSNFEFPLMKFRQQCALDFDELDAISLPKRRLLDNIRQTQLNGTRIGWIKRRCHGVAVQVT